MMSNGGLFYKADLHIPSYCFDTDSYKIRN